MKILVVDDEKDVEVLFRQKFRRELKKGLLELTFAFSGEEAMEKLAAEQAADTVYIFSDINMPGMSGLELLEKVGAAYPDIKVSMISAYADSGHYDQAIAAGAQHFFSKPIDFTSIKKEIETQLGTS
ncbi:Response regulator receiver domain-containing protein [Cyclonatronum proteinivorum]|uniref:Response regulator receiver domain-containing protein n=1 Tax=Cyclonatronum proteinivorum TaxID=1457365 RepID=A0A345UNL2_9BACT|nr:response regulator [Cyclonatronum proteinivorum]AXJ02064.1 Response regulator receiver domain-containing protein [Cyclonatronum proteinivorum]